ncbi:MAG: hypothetical protein AB1349_12475 [Elusimicrobiota bacterium]
MSTQQKLKVYLDSTIIGFSVNTKEIEKCKEANKLLEMIRKNIFDGFISYLTIKEIEQSPVWIYELLSKKIETSNLTIIKTNNEKEIFTLREKYLEKKIIPRHFEEDAEHIAIATFYSMDALVSYNFKHIVRIETMIGVNEINVKFSYKEILLCQPMEVIKYEE